MNRRRLLHACLPGATLLTGCTSLSLESRVEPIARPAWPDEPTLQAITRYAARDQEVVAHNRALEERDGTFEELNYGCAGVYEAETAGGHVVLTGCGYSETVRPGPFRAPYASTAYVGPTALLATENGVVRAEVEYDRIENAEPPSETRGFAVVNFSDEPVRIGVEVFVSSDDSNAFDATYNVGSREGVVEPTAIDAAGSYDVTAAVDGAETRAPWTVSKDPRSPIALAGTTTLDVSLSIYVLPSGSLEVHELLAERPTA